MRKLIRKIKRKHELRSLTIGKNSRVTAQVIINNPSNVVIGNNTYINGGRLHVGLNSRIIIGNDCLISYNVHFRTVSHNYINKNELIRKQGEFEKDIIIEDDCWIGYGVQIMPGVTIHRGAVVGAGAVVTKDVEEYSVVAGVPAKVIKRRK